MHDNTEEQKVEKSQRLITEKEERRTREAAEWKRREAEMSPRAKHELAAERRRAENHKVFMERERERSKANWSYYKHLRPGAKKMDEEIDEFIRKLKAPKETQTAPKPAVSKESPYAVDPSDSLADSSASDCCVVCFVEPKTHIILPCRHYCLCEKCARRRWKKCPMCRKKIKEIGPVY